MPAIQANPNGGYAITRTGRYTGYTMPNQGGTAVNANLARGAVLQAAAGQTTGSALSGAQDLTTTPLADNGYAFCQPAAGYNTPCGVVGMQMGVGELTAINTLEGVTANLRVGGPVNLTVGGYCQALVKANCTQGVTLLTPTDGQFYLSPTIGNGLIGRIVAPSTAVVDSVNTEQTFVGASVVIPANSLKVGDVIRGTVNVGQVTGGAGSLTVRLKIGANIVATSGAPVIVTGDFATIQYALVVRTIGSGGTAVGCGLSFIGTNAVAAGAADIPGGSGLASFTLDTTADTTILVSGQWSTTAGTSTAAVQIHNVYLDRLDASLGDTVFAIAMKTVDNSAAAALTPILIVQPPF